MTALLIRRCRAGPCHMDFLHTSRSKICVQVYGMSPNTAHICLCGSSECNWFSVTSADMVRLQRTLERKRKSVNRLCACSQEKLRCPRVEMESCVHAVDLERYERRAPFPLALGRHAQNAIILIVLLVVDGLASKST